MDNIKFKSLVIEEIENQFIPKIVEKNFDTLPSDKVLIKVAYSGLNFKDALSSKGHKGITKQYPHTPGIDLSGTIVESNTKEFSVGEEVLVTGYDLGMNTSGGFQEYACVPKDWVVRIPENLNLKTAMIYGTAGFTAALAIHRFQEIGIMPGTGKILVTGATGAVGTLAIALLNKQGYEVIASTGKSNMTDFLKSLGTNEVVSRQDVIDDSTRPLLPRRWKGVIENVGGITLSSVVRSVEKEGAVAIIGNVTGNKFELPIYPFILRGIALLGIESAETDMKLRKEIWSKLANDWKVNNFELLFNEIQLVQIPEYLNKMLKGELSKRTIVKLY
jgi:putative YhdH/YhfP family quinone oxidoreductase